MSVYVVIALGALLFLNLALNFALSLNVFGENAKQESDSVWPQTAVKSINGTNLLAQCLVCGLCAFVLYLVFNYCFSPLSMAYLQYFLLFPLAVLLGRFFEKLLFKKKTNSAPQLLTLSSSDAYGGMIVIQTLLTLLLSNSIYHALVLSLFFPLGVFLVTMLLAAIQFRARSEKTPEIVRGLPLILISAGLLGIIFSQVSQVVLNGIR
jgi:Na+-translocating ferredoxin:NAD+ oxidoreductase RnfA subunit